MKGLFKNKKGQTQQVHEKSKLQFQKSRDSQISDKWFIEYYYRCPADLLQFGYKEWQRFKVYEDINRYRGDYREQYAVKLCKAAQYALNEEIYNPFEALRQKLDSAKLEEILRSEVNEKQ